MRSPGIHVNICRMLFFTALTLTSLDTLCAYLLLLLQNYLTVVYAAEESAAFISLRVPSVKSSAPEMTEYTKSAAAERPVSDL